MLCVATIINPMTNEYTKNVRTFVDFDHGLTLNYKLARIFSVKEESIRGLEILIVMLAKSNEWSHVSYLPILCILIKMCLFQVLC